MLRYHIYKRLFILIKITQSLYHVTSFLQNPFADFDETLHAGQACHKEGFSTTSTSGYSPVFELQATELGVLATS